MEYLIGSILTLVTMFVMSRKIGNEISKPIAKIKFSQTRKIQLLDEFIMSIPPLVNKNRQSFKHLEGGTTRVIFISDEAYWIEDSRLLTASAPDKIINYESKKPVDTFTMDKVQLDKIEFIVRKLTEGITDDRGNSGNK